VALALEVDGKLQELLAHFELVWASAWGADANSTLGPVLGLPSLDHVKFEAVGEFGAHYKLGGVRACVGHRAAAWVDDDLGGGCSEWARSRRSPTLLVECEPQVGLTWEQVNVLIAFAEKVPQARERANDPSRWHTDRRGHGTA
jgi:hypothetical protein